MYNIITLVIVSPVLDQTYLHEWICSTTYAIYVYTWYRAELEYIQITQTHYWLCCLHLYI